MGEFGSMKVVAVILVRGCVELGERRWALTLFIYKVVSIFLILLVLFPGVSIMCESCCLNVILIWSCLPRQFHAAFFNRLQIRFLPSVLFGRCLAVALCHHAIRDVCPCFRSMVVFLIFMVLLP